MAKQPTIVPHLWFDKEAVEAATFYTSLLPGSQSHVTTLPDTPSGDADLVSFTLCGQRFMAINGGPHFTLNPSISLFVDCHSVEEVDVLWGELSQGGKALMPLDSYPWSQRYGWLQDRYGLSWQLALAEGEGAPRITPFLLFVGEVCGKAEEAIRFYTSVFEASQLHVVAHHGAHAAPDAEGTVQFAEFSLRGMRFRAMDSAWEHDFAFNEAFSFLVECASQAEIDRLWEQLSAAPEAEQCGWLKDRYGVSWQIVPSAMNDLLQQDEATVARVVQALLPMKKLDIAALQRAAEPV